MRLTKLPKSRQETIKYCDECEQPIESKYCWRILVRYGNYSSDLSYQLCRKCIIKMFPFDENECKFIETLARFRKENGLSPHDCWETEDYVDFINELIEERVPLYNYIQPVCSFDMGEEWHDEEPIFMSDIKFVLDIKEDHIKK